MTSVLAADIKKMNIVQMDPFVTRHIACAYDLEQHFHNTVLNSN